MMGSKKGWRELFEKSSLHLTPSLKKFREKGNLYFKLNYKNKRILVGTGVLDGP